MQHFEPSAQVAAKQRVLEANLWHLARLKAGQLYSPIYGAPWAYRQRARFSVHMTSKSGALVGFHERKAAHISPPAPADQGEFVSGFNACLFPDILGEHHLPPLVHAQNRLNAAP